jgi:hypothetical protein
MTTPKRWRLGEGDADFLAVRSAGRPDHQRSPALLHQTLFPLIHLNSSQ